MIDIFLIVADCAQLLKGNADDKKITVNVNIEDDVKVFVDEMSIHTVFRNLILNAIKFTPENGRIDITSKVNEDFLQVSVKDTGVGISEEQINKIFLNNQHHTTPGTNRERGSGLGTFIIKDFVKANNGRLDVRSKPGAGTEVIVSLPMHNPKT